MSTGDKSCTKCKQIKPLSDFCFIKNPNYDAGGYYCSGCKQCRSNYAVQHIYRLLESDDINDRIKGSVIKLIQAAQINARRGNGRIRASKLPYDLNRKFLTEVYHKQKGLCYYTGTPMNLRKKGSHQDPLGISLDRIDSTQGYIQGNVVLCCLGINHLKGEHDESQLYSNLRTFYTNASKLGKC